MSGLLVSLNWGDARQTPLAGDASARRYWRLSRPGETAILMVDPTGDIARFARIARHLSGLGLSAPKIYGMDQGQGQMLLEDLGDGLIARRAIDGPTEQRLYRSAIDALVVLHRHSPPSDLPIADPETLATMIEPAFTHYARDTGRLPKAIAVLTPVVSDHAMPADVMILRDFHAENILDLPDRSGAARAGLIDFQDAMTGHRAYDIASLIRDARRDLRPGTAEDTLQQYLRETGVPETPFRAAFAVLSVQRNLRILGIFARLAGQGKPNYLSLIPRVWRHLQTDLEHPACSSLREIFAQLPQPTPEHLTLLRTPCLTP